ncbi:T3SS effector HopA1 family protein [Actinoplanes sp. NPDC051411]|uniref:T3SS effector HopA1 family protein n=1 Tax=Actinoplanes sp. NPDC051411 TaxID=3155522 RepID=UPI003431C3BE
MSAPAATPIAALVEALADVWVAPDGRQAGLGGTQLEAPSARRMAERLGQELYQRLHAGSVDGDHGRRDSTLEAALAEATPHRTSPIARTRPVDGAGEGVVLIDGLRVRVPPAMLTGPEMLLPAARPALSPGHYLVDGPTGRMHGGPILRVYVHLRDPADAPARWHDVLTALNDAGVTYRAKIVSKAGGYPRRDAMVVYLGPGHWQAAGLIRDTVDGRPAVGPECSLFAHRLAPGVAAAWDPDDPRPGRRGMSFGEHRARATAEALLSDADLAAGLAECFTAASIDAARPARNHDSPSLPDLGL